MTVSMVGNVVVWVGLAADPKPSVLNTGGVIPPGSEFLELDTKITYIWSSTGWVQFSTTS